MQNKSLTKLDKLYLMLRVMLEKDGFTGRVEIHMNQGNIRNVVKIENLQLTD